MPSDHATRRLRWLSAALAPSALVTLGLGALYLLWSPASPPPPARPYPTLLVLGAAQRGGKPSTAFQRRLDHALQLYHAGGVNRVIVSGGVGDGKRYSEGGVGLRYLASKGVPRSALREEERSRTTYQNLRRSRPLFEGPVTLVTDSVHAWRALQLAQAEGWVVNVSSAPAPALRSNWRYHLREKLAQAAWTLFRYTGGRGGEAARRGPHLHADHT